MMVITPLQFFSSSARFIGKKFIKKFLLFKNSQTGRTALGRPILFGIIGLNCALNCHWAQNICLQ